jgi:hypothetical protein
MSVEPPSVAELGLISDGTVKHGFTDSEASGWCSTVHEMQTYINNGRLALGHISFYALTLQ